MSLNTKYDILDNRLVIRRLNAGDRQCFEACYRFYYKGLCSFASRWVSLPVAEDIVQDTMLYIWENRDRLMEELSLKGLLFMIVRNKSLDRITSQYFAVLTSMRSVGVMGDGRTYDYTLALRAVNTSDFMTADWSRIPYDVLDRISVRIVNEVRGINRICYDITSKPPATVEWE